MFQPFKLNITYANNSPATKSNTQYELDLTTVIPRDELLLWNRHRCIHHVDVIPGKGQLYILFFLSLLHHIKNGTLALLHHIKNNTLANYRTVKELTSLCK